MNNLKKALFVACVGLGLGFSISSYAAPSYESCLAMRESCLNGVEAACRNVINLCGIYGIEPD